jgi:thioredoxin-dependent peroxiredoxin
MPHRRACACHHLSYPRHILVLVPAIVIFAVIVAGVPDASARSGAEVARCSSPARSPRPQPAPAVATSPPRVGQPAPDFTLPTRTGDKIQLRYLHARPVLLCFFCNCGLCRAVATELARTPELMRKAQVVVVASDPNVVDHLFGRETGLEALYLKDATPPVARRYGSEGCPRCWLLDARGIVRFVNTDRLVPAKQLVQKLASALPASGPAQEARGASRYQRQTPQSAALPAIPAGRGTILTDIKTFGVTLRSGGRPISIESRDGRAGVATGRYDLLEWWAEAPDATGRLWRARGGFRPFALTVTPGATVRLNLASPLQARLAAVGGTAGIEFDVVFQGSGDDVCRGVTVDGQEPPRAHVEVRDAAGQVLADLECLYCCGFKASARWQPPAGLRGSLTAVPRVDFGPFPVAAAPVRFNLGESGLALQDR